MSNDMIEALKIIASVQTSLIAEARLREQRERLIVSVLSGICTALDIEFSGAPTSDDGLAEAAREIEQLEKMLKIEPPAETNPR